MDSEMAIFQEAFREEAAEHLRTLTGGLLKLERDPSDQAVLRQMLLSAHTLKGSAAMVGMAEAGTLAHAMEDLLTSLRDTTRRLDPVSADLLFRAFDMLHILIASPPSAAGVPDEELRQLALDLRWGTSLVEPEAASRHAESDVSPRPVVLLVEESAIVRELESALLEEAGFLVDAINDGKEALKLATAGCYDLIITGIETRSIRGPALAASVRDMLARKAPPVILMSSDDESMRANELRAIGIRACIRRGGDGQRRLISTALALVNRSK